LASRFARQDELREIAEELEVHGFVVTSRWLQSPRPLANDALQGGGPASQLAMMDLEDLQQADVCIAFTEPPDNPSPGRGGRHTELGVALGLGQKILVVGPREHVFHCLPHIEHYPDWETARQNMFAMTNRLAAI
jgi:nucleoside 2-deoxyribosyltransferase